MRLKVLLRYFFGVSRWTIQKSIRVGILAGVLILVLIAASAFLSRTKASLQPWHFVALSNEFEREIIKKELTFPQYLALEEQLFEQRQSAYIRNENSDRYSPMIRYHRDGGNNPDNFSQNYNRTYELVPTEIKGGALLVHGLTDSPYSLRAVADILVAQGFYVINMRMPGHGTIPSDLLNVTWRDWAAAIDIGTKHIKRKIGNKPFIMAGYSNGGALSLQHATRALRKGRDVPDGILLFSPAVAVTEFARISNWHKVFSWIPYFKKDRWLDILPEIDPYKYNSFPKNAGRQSWLLARAIQNNLTKLYEKQLIDKLPPILTFQSIVDATIVGEAIIDRLYLRLTQPDSELVIFDLAHSEYLDQLLAVDTGRMLEEIEANNELPFHLTVLSNKTDRREIEIRRKAPFSEQVNAEETDLEWPTGVFSLSHVAILFTPDDPIYGRRALPENTKHIQLGHLALRGERKVLLFSSEMLMRLRYNPFFPFMRTKIIEWTNERLKDSRQ